MNKNVILFFVQLFVIIGLYYLFAYYNLEYLFAILAGVLLVIFIVFNRGKMRNKEIYLEVGCDAKRYLDTIEKLHRETDNASVFHLQKSYGALYDGKVEDAKAEFQLVSFDELERKEVYEPIYYRVLALLSYYEKDETQLKQVLDQLALAEDPNDFTELLKDYIKILLLILREQYEEAIAILVETIPKQLRRVHIVELEYLLAYAYYHFNQVEDATAVTEFIVKKGYRVVYTDLCYNLYEEIKYK